MDELRQLAAKVNGLTTNNLADVIDLISPVIKVDRNQIYIRRTKTFLIWSWTSWIPISRATIDQYQVRFTLDGRSWDLAQFILTYAIYFR